MSECRAVLHKKLQKYMKSLERLKFEVNKRQRMIAGDNKPGGPRPISASTNLPQPVLLDEYTISANELDEDGRDLIESAFCARRQAYAPYSQFRVGAAFRAKCGPIYTGCNIENASLPAGICAERTAICKGISEGYKSFEGGAVVAYYPNRLITPCGVCRQFIQEFTESDIPIYIARAPKEDDAIPSMGDDDEVLVTSIYRLMPMSFTKF